LGLLEHGDDLAVGETGLLHGTSSGKGTRKFHFWRQLTCGGITIVLAAKSCLSEAELHQEWLPTLFPRVRGANAADERSAARCRNSGYNSAGNKA
ncbi:hypothetical protein, partial [Luteimonas dalianensis]|uniref:hypothetical protein n=1 Tax=Luteimonas dalianensis TaxID=1148196 RepID=UPI003BF13876